MLQQVLKELESVQGQVNLDDLSRKLGVEHRDSIVTVRRVGYKYVPTL